MAPKRKRAEDSAPAPSTSGSRSTRRSTRMQGKSDVPASAQESAPTSTSAEASPVAKRKKKAPAAPKENKAAASKKTKSVARQGAQTTDDNDPKPASASKVATPANANSSTPNPTQANGNVQSPQPPPRDNCSTTASAPTQQGSARPATPPLAHVAPQPPASSKVEPYTTQRSLALFAKYADSDNPNVIGPEGFEKLCTETGIPLEGALPLILAWQVDSQEMAKITKDEWTKGMGKLKVASLPALATALNDLQNLLIMQQGAVKKSTSKKDHDVYDKTLYLSYSQDPKASFGKLYTYCFALAKQEGSRNIDMETACAFWSVLLVPQYPIMGDVLEFLTEKGTYKATNKDLWSMMLEFCETVNPTLQDYEADGAWPTLLDDFVSWKKSKKDCA